MTTGPDTDMMRLKRHMSIMGKVYGPLLLCPCIRSFRVADLTITGLASETPGRCNMLVAKESKVEFVKTVSFRPAVRRCT